MEINGVYWEILLVSPYDPLLHMKNDFYAIGVCDNDLKVIAINEKLDDFYLKKVLCHELTHAAMYSYNINLTHYQEEMMADLMATYGQEIICKTIKVFERIT